MPPIIPDITPEIAGTPEAKAIPKQSGIATKKTVIPALISNDISFVMLYSKRYP